MHRRVVQSIIFFLVLCGMACLISTNVHEAAVRPRMSLTFHSLRLTAERIEEYRVKLGTYPPAGKRGEYQGSVSDQLLSPLSSTLLVNDRYSSSPIYKGPPLDPYRTEAAFPADKTEEAWFCDGRNSEGPFCTFRGMRPRYYRAASGRVALLIANGPDKDTDLAGLKLSGLGAQLDKLTSTSGTEMPSVIRPHCYDPTNGTISNGDVVRLLIPEEALL